jgi:hypothetical protein
MRSVMPVKQDSTHEWPVNQNWSTSLRCKELVYLSTYLLSNLLVIFFQQRNKT